MPLALYFLFIRLVIHHDRPLDEEFVAETVVDMMTSGGGKAVGFVGKMVTPARRAQNQLVAVKDLAGLAADEAPSPVAGQLELLAVVDALTPSRGRERPSALTGSY